jgi:hypothetical protein
MKKLVLGLSATAFIAGVAFAQEDPAGSSDRTRMAAADSAVFAKLDTDQDGRVSAIEAAGDSKVAAGFTSADADKDGYLSKGEFANLGRTSSSRDSSSAPRSQSSMPDNDSSTSPDR